MPNCKARSGTLYQTPDKRWVYQYRENGKRKTKRFRLKSEAMAFIRSLELVRADTPNGVKQLSEWMDEWLELYAKPTVKPATYCSYEQLIRGHIKPQIGSLYMNTLTTEDMQRFFLERSEHGNLKTNGPLSPKTLANLRDFIAMRSPRPMRPVAGIKLLPSKKRVRKARSSREITLWINER